MPDERATFLGQWGLRGARGGNATKWPQRDLNLPLAASPPLGHIGAIGDVAEWLKAAVC